MTTGALALCRPEPARFNRHVLAVLVNDRPGVLNRVASLVRARNFNIESLAVGHTERPGIVAHDHDAPRRQLRRGADGQAALPAGRRAQGPGHARPTRLVEHELALIKVRATNHKRAEVLKVIELYKGRVLDVSPDSADRRARRHRAGDRRTGRAAGRLWHPGAGADRHGGHGAEASAIDVDQILKAGAVRRHSPEHPPRSRIRHDRPGGNR